MKRILMGILFFLLLTSVASAQSKIEFLGLRGPVETVVEQTFDARFIQTYHFDETGLCTGEMREDGDSFISAGYDSKERLAWTYHEPIGRSARQDREKYIYEDEKGTFYIVSNFYQQSGKLDEQGRVIESSQRRELAGGSGAQEVRHYRFRYDNRGNLLQINVLAEDENLLFSNEYEYNEKNQLISKKMIENQITVEYSRYTYNQAGFLTKEVFKEKNAGGINTYRYQEVDSHGNWTKRTAYFARTKREVIETREITYFE